MLGLVALTFVAVMKGIYHMEPPIREITCAHCSKITECEVHHTPLGWLQVKRDDGTDELELYCSTHCLLDSLGSGERVENG
jgi:hypothetical protein